MPRRPTTPEQARERDADRQRKIASLRAQLDNAAGGLHTPADWERCLRLAARIPGEDFANILLISAQHPTATLVRDYQGWTAAGRQVRRGETGIEIFHLPPPSRQRQEQPANDQNRTWREADRVAHVWDISQTTGPASYTGTGPPPAQDPARLWDPLHWLARREGYAIEREHGAPADGTTYWAAHRIRLLPDLTGQDAVWALAHQLGHILLHDMPGYPPTATTAGCAGTRKAEADAVAVIICTRYGIPARRELSRPASWAGSDPRAQPAAAILAAGQRIITASRRIAHHTDRILHGDNPAPGTGIAPSTPAPAHAGIPAKDATSSHHTAQPSAAAGRIRSALTAAQEFYVQQLETGWAPAYLHARGITKAICHEWHIGYAPAGWTSLTDHLRHLGHSDDEIQAAGLAKPSSRGTLIDLFRDRVMLPVHHENGTLTGFIGRAHPDAPHAPKYLNSPETAEYKKSELLFGLHHARSALAQGAVPVIVEGPFDAIAVTTASPAQYAGLAPCGTALTCQQAAALSRAADLEHGGMLIAFDSDTAGRKAAIRSHSILRPFTWKLHSVSLDSKDPAEIMQLDGSVTLRTILNERRQPLSAMVIDARIDTWERRLRDPDGPYRAMISGASLIAELLPPDSADQIRVITQNREIQTIDELLRPVYSSELSQIAPILPADTAYQIARIADRLGCDACDVLAEVANTITRRPHPPKGPGVTQLPSPGDIESACPPTAAQLARTSFPRSPAPAQVNTACSARRPAPSVNRSRPARTTRFRA